MKCALCNTELTQTGKFWVCPEHGLVQPSAPSAPAVGAGRPQSVFISYGREDALEFAKRLAADLKAHGGHTPFFDLEAIEKGGLWDVRIEQGVRAATVVAAVMTPHALRASSVCRDEVLFALNEGKNVLPLKAAPHPQLNSLLLSRRNWIDFSSDYQAGLDALLRYLAGDQSGLRPPALPTITGVVPLDFGPEIARLTADFTGRAWVNPQVDHWLGTSNCRVLVLVAEPGIGKSAIAAWLTQAREDVVGVHFCTQQNSRTRDPYEFVANLVAQLYVRLPGFANAVETRYPDVRRPTASDAFRELIIETARAMPASDSARLLIVDSLDEALDHAGETVLDVLVQQAADLPDWLRIIATTRPEDAVLQRIRTLNVLELMAERAENRADVREYIRHRLDSPTLAAPLQGADRQDIAAQLDALSEGNYLYARMALDALQDRSLRADEIHHLSPGLANFFYESFRRRFADPDDYERKHAVLAQALVASRGPLPLKTLQMVSGERPEVTRRRLHDLRSYLRINGQGEAANYALYHRSLKDWLSDAEASGAYWCPRGNGDRALAKIGWGTYSNGDLGHDDYFARYLADHLLAAEEWDQLAQLLSDIEVFARIWEEGRKYEWMRYWQQLRPHTAPAASYEASLDRIRPTVAAERMAYFSEIIGWFLRDMNLLSEAQPFTENALHLREETFGKDHPEVADSIHSLAELYRAQKNFEAALPLYERALEVRRRYYGSESPEVATSLHDLAEFHQDCRHYAQALDSYRRALAIRQSAQIANDPAVADCLNDMATLLFEQGNGEEALPNYEAALQIFEAAHGRDHPDVAACLHNIARLQLHDRAAIPLCVRAFQILDRTFGPNHPKTQRCTATLVDIYEAAAQFAELPPLKERLLDAKRHMLGPDHPEVECALKDLADSYARAGDLKKAAGCYRDVGAIRERTLGSHTVELAEALETLCWQLLARPHPIDAVSYANRAVAIKEAVLGRDHPDTATSLNVLIRCLQEKGEHSTALPVCFRALQIRERHLPANDPETATSLNNLGLSLVQLGRLQEAEQYLLRAVAMNPDSAYPYYWLAKLYQQRAEPGDSRREASQWQAYLELGATSAQRQEEAESRLTELDN